MGPHRHSHPDHFSNDDLDRITALDVAEYLPLPEGYVNYARIAIVLKNFVGSAAQPTSVDITKLLCQKIDIVSRNPHKSW